MAQQRSPIRFTGASKAMTVLGLRASNSHVEVGGDTVEVLTADGSSATFPRASVASVGDGHGRVWGWVVHGGRGTWLVNGSSGGLVRTTVPT